MIAPPMSGRVPGFEELWVRQLDAARRGSKAALGQILNSCQHYLFAFADQSLHPRLRSKFDTADLVQETFLDAQRRFDTFHGDTRSQLLAWLRRILINNMLNLSRGYCESAKRSVGREQSLTADVAAGRGCPAEEVQAREELDRVSACLAQLPEHYQRVILLRFHEECSFAEIGRLMDRSEDAAQKLWDRALVLLRRKLGL